MSRSRAHKKHTKKKQITHTKIEFKWNREIDRKKEGIAKS